MNNSTEKISIIGGSGFVGSSLSSKFIALDKSFEIIDIKENILFEDKTKIADVTDIDELTSKVSGNILINLAAEHRDDVKPISRYDHVNIEGAKNICKLAELKGIEKIIFTSTVAIYGLSDEQKNEESEIRISNATAITFVLINTNGKSEKRTQHYDYT